MIETTLETIIRTAKDVVADAPEGYTYSSEVVGGHFSCYYVHGNKPGCIVGQIAHRLGVPLAELRKHEGTGSNMVVRDHFAFPSAVQEDGAREFLSTLQAAQDGNDGDPTTRMTWADALAHALSYIPAGVGA